MTYTLTVPGHHEARALTVRCPLCGSLTAPAVVLDTGTTREAGYGCVCGHRWVKPHPMPAALVAAGETTHATCEE